MKQRHEWDLEEKRHNIKREKWEEDFQRKQRLEEQKHNLVRKEWEGERVDFREKQRLEEENCKTVRKAWEEEHAVIHNDRKRWDQERKNKEDQERYEKDEESRKRRGIAWDGFQALGCLRYETRQYTATLVNVPLGFNAVDECQKKAIQIHGRDLFPSRCEDQGTCGKVTAHWEVDFNEPGCTGTPWFGEFEDKGCVQPGIHRYNGKLEDIHDWDNWETICATMTANYGNVHLGNPTSCSACNGGSCGHWAIWLMEDKNCYRR
ncbi:hypothetical protein BDZ97DRAFT_70306 [Flammula alnicola]|nr:hypothetical protein BDZ97DRAFT_70306 [Flammula alnicola]